MTAPVWMASPPEVHSAMLTSGPGPGPLLVAAAQWRALAGHYGEAHTELAGILAEVQAGSWQGPSAGQYVMAHAPYLAWLERAAAGSAVTASQHETVAAAYSAALATMPSLAELTANHTTHAVLVATNFLGINTIPITLNEADYLRMWIQAAETMTVYEAVSKAALTAVPRLEPAPPILAYAGEAASAATGNPQQDMSGWLARLVKDIADFIADPYSHFLEFFERLGVTPGNAIVLAAIAVLLYDVLWYPYYAAYGLLLAPLFTPMLSALGALGALGALALWPRGTALPDLQPTPEHPTNTSERAETRWPLTATPAPPSSAPATPQASAPVSTGAPPSGSAPASPTPPPMYAVPGLRPPGTRFGPAADTTADAAAEAALTATAAAAASARSRRRTRRRSKDGEHAPGYRYEFLDAAEAMDTDPDLPDGVPHSSPSGQGAGELGRTGALGDHAAAPRGIVGHSESHARIPLLPSPWPEDGEKR